MSYSQDVGPSRVLKHLVPILTLLPLWGLVNQCGRSNEIAPFISLCQESGVFSVPLMAFGSWLRTTINSHKPEHRLCLIPHLLHYRT